VEKIEQFFSGREILGNLPMEQFLMQKMIFCDRMKLFGG
jgi:hypothetical protein